MIQLRRQGAAPWPYNTRDERRGQPYRTSTTLTEVAAPSSLLPMLHEEKGHGRSIAKLATHLVEDAIFWGHIDRLPESVLCVREILDELFGCGTVKPR
jgi:hypothetical protein